VEERKDTLNLTNWVSVISEIAILLPKE